MRTRSTTPAREAGPVLLVVAHGSRDPRHAETVRALVARVRGQRPGQRVETSFLDFDAPDPATVLERLAAEGAGHVIALPLLLTRAFHARSDIPAVLAAAGARLPGLRIRQAGVLGPSPLLFAAAERRLAAAGAGFERAERARTGVVLAAAGTSDPGARAVIEAAAADWRGRAGWAAVTVAYASAAGPRVEDAVRELRTRPGVARVAVSPYVLAPGRLPDRIAAGAREAGAEALAEVLGAAPELAALLLTRFDAAAAPRRVPVPALAG
ncbi:sirohydrochlorin chelatase [Streptomyces sp. BI20]|uniref:sirohydrochlorin chelatase n=1 Tax=Streptomyces sp. BI20 TaxID=3403460 RepID=UPI003C7758E9